MISSYVFDLVTKIRDGVMAQSYRRLSYVEGVWHIVPQNNGTRNEACDYSSLLHILIKIWIKLNLARISLFSAVLFLSAIAEVSMRLSKRPDGTHTYIFQCLCTHQTPNFVSVRTVGVQELVLT